MHENNKKTKKKGVNEDKFLHIFTLFKKWQRNF